MSPKRMHVLKTLSFALNLVAVAILYFAPRAWGVQVYWAVLGVLVLDAVVEAYGWYKLPVDAPKKKTSVLVASLMVNVFTILLLVLVEPLGLNVVSAFQVALVVMVIDTVVEAYSLYKMP